MSPPRNTLGLVGDGDEFGLISDIEKSFGVALRNAPADSIWTVGDLYRFVVGRLQPAPRDGNLDSTVRAYRALLPILQRYAGTSRIRPSTRLADIFSATEYRRALIEIRRQQNCRVPHQTLNGPAGFLALAAVGSPFLGLAVLFLSILYHDLKPFAVYAFFGLPFFGALAWVATVLGGYDLSGEKYTVAWLARGIAALNYKRFADGHFEARDVWNAVRRIAEDHKETDCDVVHETTIIGAE